MRALSPDVNWTMYVGDRCVGIWPAAELKIVPDSGPQDYCPTSIETVEFSITPVDPVAFDDWVDRIRLAAAIQQYIHPSYPTITRTNTRSSAGVGTFRGWFSERTEDALIASGELSDIVPYPCEATAAPEILGDIE